MNKVSISIVLHILRKIEKIILRKSSFILCVRVRAYLRACVRVSLCLYVHTYTRNVKNIQECPKSLRNVTNEKKVYKKQKVKKDSEKSFYINIVGSD